MLRKLMKHEWKENSKIGCLMLLITAIITFLGWLAFRSPMWKSIYTDTETTMAGTIANAMSLVTLLLYFGMLIGVSYGILIYFMVHFYKTMYTDQGYLIHTLPVTKHQILGSKILVNGIWCLIIYLGLILSVFTLVFSLLGAVTPEGFSLWQVLAEIDLSEFLSVLSEEFGINMTLWSVCCLLFIVVAPFFSITIIYGSITIGQLCTKHRVLMAIAVYIGIDLLMVLSGSVMGWRTSAINYSVLAVSGDLYGIGEQMRNVTLGTFLISLTFAVVLYFISHYILKKKLNME